LQLALQRGWQIDPRETTLYMRALPLLNQIHGLKNVRMRGTDPILWSFLPRKGTKKHKNLDGRVRAAGRFLCIFVPLCGYDFAGGWVVPSDLRVSSDSGR